MSSYELMGDNVYAVTTRPSISPVEIAATAAWKKKYFGTAPDSSTAMERLVAARSLTIGRDLINYRRTPGRPGVALNQFLMMMSDGLAINNPSVQLYKASQLARGVFSDL